MIEAYRIEVIDKEQTGASASSTYLGYRFGMMMSGAGALFLAATFSWQTTYEIMAAFTGIGLLTTLLCPSPKTLVSVLPIFPLPLLPSITAFGVA